MFNNKLLTDETLDIFATILCETKTLGILGIPNFRYFRHSKL